MWWFITGVIVGIGIGWFFTRLWYSSHAKNEVKDTINTVVNKMG